MRDTELYPNWHFMTNNVCLKAGFNNEDVIIHFSVREISMTDYYRHEASQASINYASSQILQTPRHSATVKEGKYDFADDAHFFDSGL